MFFSQLSLSLPWSSVGFLCSQLLKPGWRMTSFNLNLVCIPLDWLNTHQNLLAVYFKSISLFSQRMIYTLKDIITIPYFMSFQILFWIKRYNLFVSDKHQSTKEIYSPIDWGVLILSLIHIEHINHENYYQHILSATFQLV